MRSFIQWLNRLKLKMFPKAYEELVELTAFFCTQMSSENDWEFITGYNAYKKILVRKVGDREAASIIQLAEANNKFRETFGGK